MTTSWPSLMRRPLHEFRLLRYLEKPTYAGRQRIGMWPVDEGVRVCQVLLVLHPAREQHAEFFRQCRAVTHHSGKVFFRNLVNHHEGERPCISAFSGIDEDTALTEKITRRQTGQFGPSPVLGVLDYCDAGPHDHE